MLLTIDELGKLQLELATPVTITKDISDEELAFEFNRMSVRSRATSEFLQGIIEYDTYCDIMQEYGCDIRDAEKSWENGKTFL